MVQPAVLRVGGDPGADCLDRLVVALEPVQSESDEAVGPRVLGRERGGLAQMLQRLLRAPEVDQVGAALAGGVGGLAHTSLCRRM